MQAGNIGNLIRAMAALYLLNIYYRDESFEGGTIVVGEPFDARLGSEVFAISVAHAEECSIKDEMSDDGIAENVKKELDSCAYMVYIIIWMESTGFAAIWSITIPHTRQEQNKQLNCKRNTKR